MTCTTDLSDELNGPGAGGVVGRPRFGGVAAVVIAFVGLSLGSTIAKASGSPGAVVAFWRFLIGALLWHMVIAVRGSRRGTRRTADAHAWRLGTVPGIAFGVNLSLFFSGVDRTPIAHAEFINAFTPLVMVPLAARLLGERVPRYVVVSGGLAISGIVLILSHAPAGGTSYLGDGLVVGAMIAWVIYLMRSRSVRETVGTADFMAVMSTVACVATLPVALLASGSPSALVGLSAKAWLLVALLAVVAGVVAHGLIAWAQGRVGVGTMSMLQLSQPGLGVLWAAAFLDESVAGVQIIGMTIVLAAVGTIAWRTASGTGGLARQTGASQNLRCDVR
jgi:drug/metabolite transporter (DMT)-like permease